MEIKFIEFCYISLCGLREKLATDPKLAETKSQQRKSLFWPIRIAETLSIPIGKLYFHWLCIDICEHLEIVFSALHLLGVLRRFQHCTGHITTGSWKGGGNQYIQFVRVLYCKLPTNSKQLPAFPLQAVPGTEARPLFGPSKKPLKCHPPIVGEAFGKNKPRSYVARARVRA